MRKARAMTQSALAMSLLAAAMATPGVSPALAAQPEHHCINPDGFDLNELHGTPHQIVTNFCPVAIVGEPWIPAAGWVTNVSHEVIPDGYVPSRPTPIEDFNAKFIGARYVVDSGTKQERTFTFGAGEILQTGLTYPGTSFPLSAFLPVLRPLSVGAHTIDIFVTMSADHWGGFTLDPVSDLIPAGESPWTRVAFDVVPRSVH